MAGRPITTQVKLCRYCQGDRFYEVVSRRGIVQHCLGCGWCPQDRPENAEPVEINPKKKGGKQ